MSDNSRISWTSATWNLVIGWRESPRIVDPRGYVLRRLPDHHRADVRGLVYEHIVVAEEMLGRPIIPGEQVRHLDGSPGNNDPRNLRVVSRSDEIAVCACGCGAQFPAQDSSRRPRRYVSGHNPIPSPTIDAVLGQLRQADRCLTPAEICKETGIGPRALRVALSKLARSGAVERPRFGYYRMPGSAAPFPAVAATGRPRCELGSGIPGDLKEMLLEDFGGLCGYGCGRRAATWDHLIPWSLGGSFKHPGNIVPACSQCNLSKTDSPPAEWVEKALMADYSADPMEQVTTLAIVCGAASPEDFMTAEQILEMHPSITRGEWHFITPCPPSLGRGACGTILARELGLKGAGSDPSEWPEAWPQEYPAVTR